MKKILLFIVSIGCGSIAVGDWIDWNVDAAIPDNEPMGLADTQSLSGYDNVIESIEVRLTISGNPLAFNGDFFASLQSGNGGYAVLLNRVGRTETDPLGYGDNGFDITFTLSGTDIHLYQDHAPTYDGQGRLTGIWGADGRNVDPDVVLDTYPRTANLHSFHGIDPNGNWTLFVADMNLNGDATLDSWGLNISVIPEPGTLGLLALGVVGIAALRKRRA